MKQGYELFREFGLNLDETKNYLGLELHNLEMSLRLINKCLSCFQKIDVNKYLVSLKTYLQTMPINSVYKITKSFYNSKNKNFTLAKTIQLDKNCNETNEHSFRFSNALMDDVETALLMCLPLIHFALLPEAKILNRHIIHGSVNQDFGALHTHFCNNTTNAYCQNYNILITFEKLVDRIEAKLTDNELNPQNLDHIYSCIFQINEDKLTSRKRSFQEAENCVNFYSK